MDTSGLLQVEAQRRELEENIGKLRKSLQHWQSWEIEYEGLREEIASLPDGSNTDAVFAVAREFGANLVDDKELQTIVDGNRGSPRNQNQIIDLLANRVDYVSRNARTIEKQLSDAQKKRNALLLAEEPDYREDAGLPLADITEELDDEGNVVSTKVEKPGATAPQLLDVLKKAGVEDVLEHDGIITGSKNSTNSWNDRQPDSLCEKVEATTEISTETDMAVERGGAVHERQSKKPFEQELELGKKLTDGEWNDKREGGSAYDMSDVDRPWSDQKHRTHSPARGVSLGSKRGKDGIEEVMVGKTVSSTQPEDTPEEADLRREMLQYGLGEVGAIVAELDLEETRSDVSFDQDEAVLSFDSDIDEDDIDDEDTSEDENGMVKHPAMSRKYLQKMKELEEKYGIKGMQNLGPDTSKFPRELHSGVDRPDAQTARKTALAREANATDAVRPVAGQTEHRSTKQKKKVAFAEDLAIVPETETQRPSKTASEHRPARLPLVEPFKDSIVERQSSIISTATAQSSTQTTAGKKPSKFKAAREATPQTPLLPPSPSRLPQQPPQKNPPESRTSSNKPHADSIIEREVTNKPKPPDHDDLDEALHRQEIAGEYYKLRNRMIQRQGGFVGEGEAENYGEEITPLPIVDEDGKERKISRFKAARLR
jgi:unconventional prefoldin RPB5 interactor 1